MDGKFEPKLGTPYSAQVFADMLMLLNTQDMVDGGKGEQEGPQQIFLDMMKEDKLYVFGYNDQGRLVLNEYNPRYVAMKSGADQLN